MDVYVRACGCPFVLFSFFIIFRCIIDSLFHCGLALRLYAYFSVSLSLGTRASGLFSAAADTPREKDALSRIRARGALKIAQTGIPVSIRLRSSFNV